MTPSCIGLLYLNPLIESLFKFLIYILNLTNKFNPLFESSLRSPILFINFNL